MSSQFVLPPTPPAPPENDVASVAAPLSQNPTIDADSSKDIAAQFVAAAEKVVEAYANKPHQQAEEIYKIKSAYMQAQYGEALPQK